ncbi:hypothetical protein M569_07537, partial [Genlisea aurea]
MVILLQSAFHVFGIDLRSFWSLAVTVMKKLYGGVVAISFFMLLFLGFYIIKNPISECYFTTPANLNGTDPLRWISDVAPPALSSPENSSEAVSTAVSVAELIPSWNFSEEAGTSLQTWKRMKRLLPNAQALPNAVDAIKEAGAAWSKLLESIEEERELQSNGLARGKEKQCPNFLSEMNASRVHESEFKLRVPCGLTQGSSITLIGVPNGLLGNFRVDLTGEPLPGEPDPPIILHYNVRLHGDKVTEDPVIVQNTWMAGRDWGEEERCPDSETTKKVDELEKCNGMVGKAMNHTKHFNGSMQLHDGNPRKYFPFKQNDLFVATLRVGSEGIQMTVDGKHITSFAFRETLEPWLVSEVRISGDVNLISVVASGLPTSEDVDHTVDLESLKAVPIQPRKQLDLFVGVFSTANNFKRRMAVRRSWMQYPEVRSGKVAVRFFVGL